MIDERMGGYYCFQFYKIEVFFNVFLQKLQQMKNILNVNFIKGLKKV